jgi:cytochrome b6-f complex iron-sulfur subunit
MGSRPARPEPAPGATGRRHVLQGLLMLGAGAPLVLAWLELGARREHARRPRRVELPSPTSDGVFFHDDVILVRRGAELRALSAKCPHLGCRIGMLVGASLVCPCHGSSFDPAGRRLGGPASSDLERLTIEPGSHAETVGVVLSG